jgi:hypothetical protein
MYMKENEIEHLLDEIGWKILGELPAGTECATGQSSFSAAVKSPAVAPPLTHGL